LLCQLSYRPYYRNYVTERRRGKPSRNNVTENLLDASS
jgi:hypothetical protein